MKKIFIVLLIFSLFLVGCNDKEKINNEANNVVDEQVNEEEIDVIETENQDDELITKKEESNKKEDKEPKFYSELTGLEVKESIINRRPIAVMLDNHYKARPQANLSKADIVYEILAEGKITRYMAIYQSIFPENIGPVRSARPYFIKKALELGSFYVHVGGSPQAFKDIDRFNVKDIDAMASGYNTFWRKNHKNIPHNMYTSSNAILKEADRKKYSLDNNIDFFEFNNELKNLNGEKAKNIKIFYKKPDNSDSYGYISEYRYLEDQNKYLRYTNNEKYLDESTDNEIKVTNIIIQFAKHKVYDNKGRKNINLIGSGKAKLITNGEVIDLDWKKDSVDSKTIFLNKDGEKITLNKGKTWIQVVPLDIEIEIN
ncbi:MAG: DUF3048 domain-containing protein [Bacillota bacterium]